MKGGAQTKSEEERGEESEKCEGREGWRRKGGAQEKSGEEGEGRVKEAKGRDGGKREKGREGGKREMGIDGRVRDKGREVGKREKGRATIDRVQILVSESHNVVHVMLSLFASHDPSHPPRVHVPAALQREEEKRKQGVERKMEGRRKGDKG